MNNLSEAHGLFQLHYSLIVFEAQGPFQLYANDSMPEISERHVKDDPPNRNYIIF